MRLLELMVEGHQLRHPAFALLLRPAAVGDVDEGAADADGAVGGRRRPRAGELDRKRLPLGRPQQELAALGRVARAHPLQVAHPARAVLGRDEAVEGGRPQRRPVDPEE